VVRSTAATGRCMIWHAPRRDWQWAQENRFLSSMSTFVAGIPEHKRAYQASIVAGRPWARRSESSLFSIPFFSLFFFFFCFAESDERFGWRPFSSGGMASLVWTPGFADAKAYRFRLASGTPADGMLKIRRSVSLGNMCRSICMKYLLYFS